MSDQTNTGTKYLRTALILMIVALAFVASYQIAGAAGRDSTVASSPVFAGNLIPAAAGGVGDSGLPCACCEGSAGTGEPIEGAAVIEGDVQRITVDTSNGYNPNVIKLAAGIPAEITFGQAGGCLAEVQSESLGFYADLTRGDAAVRIEADVLQPGTYEFSCGMRMVFGTIVVE